MGISTVIAVVDGVLTAVPNSVVTCRHRGKPFTWAGALKSGDHPTDVGEFFTDKGCETVYAERMRVGCAVVFAKDLYVDGRVVVYNRWYGVIRHIDESCVVLEQFGTAKEAYDRSCTALRADATSCVSL